MKNATGALARIRREKNLTQTELGEILGVAHTTVANWENGRRFPSYSLFRSLREALGVDRETLEAAFDSIHRRNGPEVA